MFCQRYSLLLYFISDFSKMVLSTTVPEKKTTFLGEIVKALYHVDLTNQTKLMSMFQLDDQYLQHADHVKQCKTNKTRFKRQGSKFTESAKMGQTKVFRLQLQLFKNMMVKNPVGPPHPLHPMAPSTFIELVQSKVIEYFSPDITQPPKVNN